MLIDFRNNGGGGRAPIIESLDITANGTYEAPHGTDGYSPVTVNVPTGSLDLSGTGWETEKVLPVSVERQDIVGEDIEYTRVKFAEWGGGKETTSNLYVNDMDLVYAPLINIGNVSSSNWMFANCPNLVAIPNLDFSRTYGMVQAFQDCVKLVSIPKLNTKNLVNMLYIFERCSSLVYAPEMITREVSKMDRAFASCTSLIKVPTLDITRCDTMKGIFAGCTSLLSVEFKGKLKTGCAVDGMFERVETKGTATFHIGNGVSKDNFQPIIDQLPVSWRVEYVSDEAPAKVEAKKTVEISQNGATEITPSAGYQGIEGATVNVNVPIPAPTTEEKTVSIVSNGQTIVEKSTGVDGMSKVTVDVNVPSSGGGSFDWEGTGYSPEEEGKVYTKMQADIDYTKQKYSEWDPSRTSADKLYNEDKKLVYAPAIDTSKVTDMGYCFRECLKLTNIPEMNTSKVTDMSFCFYSCSSLTTIPMLDTSKVTDMFSCFDACSSLAAIPPLDTSKVTDMGYCFRECDSLTTIPALNTAQVINMESCFSFCNSLTSVEFEGGVAPGCNCSNMFQGVETTGTFYYHLPGDYSPVIAKLPETWTAVPLGTVSFKIRVLKDTNWLTGDQNLVMGGKTLTYEGKGIYTTTLTFTREGPNPSTDLLLDGVKIGTAKATPDEQIFETGDNSSLETNKVGADILTIVPEGGNTDGWAYDEQVKGVKSVSKSGGQSTLKLSIPGSFTMTYGQDSESGYDYARLLNGAGTEIVSFKGKKTGPDGQEVFEGSTSDGIVQAVYQKDSSGDTGLDAFWIKSIVYKALPPYPAA